MSVEHPQELQFAHVVDPLAPTWYGYYKPTASFGHVPITRLLDDAPPITVRRLYALPDQALPICRYRWIRLRNRFLVHSPPIVSENADAVMLQRSSSPPPLAQRHAFPQAMPLQGRCAVMKNAPTITRRRALGCDVSSGVRCQRHPFQISVARTDGHWCGNIIAQMRFKSNPLCDKSWPCHYPVLPRCGAAVEGSARSTCGPWSRSARLYGGIVSPAFASRSTGSQADTRIFIQGAVL